MKVPSPSRLFVVCFDCASVIGRKFPRKLRGNKKHKSKDDVVSSSSEDQSRRSTDPLPPPLEKTPSLMADSSSEYLSNCSSTESLLSASSSQSSIMDSPPSPSSPPKECKDTSLCFSPGIIIMPSTEVKILAPAESFFFMPLDELPDLQNVTAAATDDWGYFVDFD